MPDTKTSPSKNLRRLAPTSLDAHHTSLFHAISPQKFGWLCHLHCAEVKKIWLSTSSWRSDSSLTLSLVCSVVTGEAIKSDYLCRQFTRPRFTFGSVGLSHFTQSADQLRCCQVANLMELATECGTQFSGGLYYRMVDCLEGRIKLSSGLFYNSFLTTKKYEL